MISYHVPYKRWDLENYKSWIVEHEDFSYALLILTQYII